MARTYYGEFEPDLRLRRRVACYWEFRVPEGSPPHQHTIPPDGGVSWCWTRRPGRMLFNGPCLVPLQPEVSGGDRYWGVRLWPGASRSFFSIPPEELRDRHGLASDFVDVPWMGEMAERLARSEDQDAAKQALDAVLLDRLDEAPPLDPVVMAAVFEILQSRGRIAVTELAKGQSLSERQFRRRFKSAVGLAPKELTRIHRVRASIIDAVGSQSAWAELAPAHGYADQAHLAREFRDLAGLPPRQLKAYLDTIEHGPVRR